MTQNVPPPTARGANGKQSNDESQKREELTNYEISSKTITTVSGGFSVENISVAVLVNRASLLAAMGGKPTPSRDGQAARRSPAARRLGGGSQQGRAAIRSRSRPSISPIAARCSSPCPAPGFTEIMLRQTGTIINGVVVLAVAFLMIWFGIRPVDERRFRRRQRSADPELGAAVDGGRLRNAGADDGAAGRRPVRFPGTAERAQSDRRPRPTAPSARR